MPKQHERMKRAWHRASLRLRGAVSALAGRPPSSRIAGGRLTSPGLVKLLHILEFSRCDKSRRSAGGRRTDGRVCAYGDAQRRAGAYRRPIHWSRPTLRWFRRAFGTGIGGSAAGSTISRSRGTNVCLHPATSPPAHGRRARRAGLLLIRQDQNYPQNQAASTRPMSQDTPPPRVRRDLSSWNRGTRSSHTGTRFCRPRSGTCSRRSLPRPRACRAARR